MIQIAPATLSVIVKWRNHLQYIKIEEFAFRRVVTIKCYQKNWIPRLNGSNW